MSIKLDLDRDTTVPLYQRLSDELRNQVRSGRLKPGDRLPSFSQLRAEYGIHKTTVERAHQLLEQEGVVVREERRGIFVASAAELEAATARLARGASGHAGHISEGHAPQSRRQRNVIAFCGVGHLIFASSPYWTELLSGIYETLRARSIHLLLTEAPSAEVREQADGVLVNPIWARPQRSWQGGGWPAVTLVVRCPNLEISSVTADDYGGQRAATEHLIALGHRRIAYLHSSEKRDLLTVPQRRRGYEDALRQAGIEPDPAWVRPLNGGARVNFGPVGQRSMEAWLEDGWKELGCTAVLAHNDGTAIGVIAALEKAGLKVPEDVSVIGFDDAGLAAAERQRLTTVEVPLQDIGRNAAEMVLRQIDGEVRETEHRVLPTNLCIRKTTAPPRR